MFCVIYLKLKKIVIFLNKLERVMNGFKFCIRTNII